MQPSSLVFLVIIAVWAAYFVQYWIRRREHLATARSVDQFSESMRVLERRGPLPGTDLSTPRPRSYAVSPARPARAQVLVKRAETPAGPRAGFAARGGETTADDRPRVDAAFPDREVPARELSARDRAAARRTRAMVMLGALSTVVVTVPLVALSLLPALTLLVPLVAVGIAVVWARSTAQAERRARLEQRLAPRATSRAQAPRSAAKPVRDTHRQPVERSTAVDTAGWHGSSAAEADVEAQAGSDVRPSGDREPELFDMQAEETRVTQRAADGAGAAFVASSDAPEAAPTTMVAPLVDEDDIPLTWDPVPVPRPTYAMKSRVTRPAPTAADLVGDADTEYAAYDDAEQLRRVAGA